MLWLEVLQSLEGGAGAIEGQLARFKPTQSCGVFCWFFFQKQRGNSEELVPATSVLNHSIVCPSAAYGSCTSHALPSEIRVHTLPRSHCDHTVTITGRNESWATTSAFKYWHPEGNKWTWACLCLFSASRRWEDRRGNADLVLPFPWGALIHSRACAFVAGRGEG